MATTVTTQENYRIERRADSVPVSAPFTIKKYNESSIPRSVHCWVEKFHEVDNGIWGHVPDGAHKEVDFNIYTVRLNSEYKYVGQTCLFLFAKAARERGFDLVCDANIQAVRFYQKMGFVIDDRHYDKINIPAFKALVVSEFDKIQQGVYDPRILNIQLRLDSSGFDKLRAIHEVAQRSLAEMTLPPSLGHVN
jgi:hypothetical protein